MSQQQRVNLSPAYLLHARPYRDSSVIADFFTFEHGRVALVARGVRRPKSRNRGMIRPFKRVLLSWVSRGSLGTLTQIESDGQFEFNLGKRLMSAFYLNELILRALKQGDCHSDVFHHYEVCLHGLSQAQDEALALRVFERDLLEQLGYGLSLDHDAGGQPIANESRYHYDITAGLTVAEHGSHASYSGAAIQGLAKSDFNAVHDSVAQADAKRLLRYALDYHLGSTQSRVRDVSRTMNSRQRAWPQKLNDQ